MFDKLSEHVFPIPTRRGCQLRLATVRCAKAAFLKEGPATHTQATYLVTEPLRAVSRVKVAAALLAVY